MAEEEKEFKLGTFQGVLTPTLLTILGVIMYLRLGWVVGSVGLIGAWVIIIMSFAITAATALSMSSITTNMKIGAGGAYSIISRSLGLEIGGSIGLPLYLSLALSMVMYIFGFRAGIQLIYPDVSALLIDFAAFGLLVAIVFISTKFAFKIQYIILAVIIGSLVSVFAAGINAHPNLEIIDDGSAGSFWLVFAVFFPAATGIMAGANMSGELKKPKKSIPFGTLAAIGISLVIYIIVAYWLAASTTQDQLLGNYTIIVDIALWSDLVLAGLLAATFSSALNSLVGASRILQAMGDHNIMPGSNWLKKKSQGGEPRNAILFTSLIVMMALLLRDLNTIAPIITMFFLITYTMINIVIIIEQNLGLVSFRPLMKIPRYVPIFGASGCLFSMFIINPLFGLVSMVIVGVFYYVLMHRKLNDDSPYGDVRSSLFVALAEWAAKKSKGLPHSHERAWKPNLLVPIEDTTELRGVANFLRDLTFPSGSVNILGVNMRNKEESVKKRMRMLSRSFQKENIYSTWTIMSQMKYVDDIVSSLDTLKRAFFSPNTLFLRMPRGEKRESEMKTIINKAMENDMGIMIYAGHPRAGLGQRRVINLYMPESCLDWEPSMKLPNCDLAILAAYKLKMNWDARIKLIAIVKDEEKLETVRANLDTLIEMSRIPIENIFVDHIEFDEFLKKAPQADLSILALSKDSDFDRMREIIIKTRSTCLFCQDSGMESALA